jgi:hypothetical protein
MTHHCTVYYRDGAREGVGAIPLLDVLSTMSVFFSENGSAAHMTHHCTVYYRDVLVTVPGGVTFISLLVLLSTMSSIGGMNGWKGQTLSTSCL